MVRRLLRLLAICLAGLAPLAAQAPVHLDGETVFTIQARVASFTPEVRAAAVEGRLHRLAADPFLRAKTIEAVNNGESTDLMAGDLLLITVTEADASAAGVSRPDLAQAWSQAMRAALERHSLAHRAKALAIAGAQTLAVTLGALLLLWLLGRAFRRLYARIASSDGVFRGFRIQNLELLSTERVRLLAKRGAQLLRLALTLILAYVYLSIVFSFFPWTKGLASRLLALVWAPVSQLGAALLGYLPKLLFLAVIVLATRWLLKAVHLVFTGLENGALRIEGFHPDWAQPTYKLARLLAMGFALVVAFPYLPGSGSEAFKGVSLFVGLLFSLGSSGAVANMIAGVMITYMRPFRLGDVIQIGETRGTVVEKSLLVTRIRTPKHVDVTLPNSAILGSQIQNFTTQSKDGALLLHTTVTIGYDVPWRQVHELLITAAGNAEGLLQNPPPFVNQTSLDDFYVSYQINAATDDPERMNQIYSRLHEAIQDAFFKAGVEIMSPHYAALRDGNGAAIPEAQLPSGYRPSGFRIEKA